MYRRSAILICALFIFFSGVLFPLALDRAAELPAYSSMSSWCRSNKEGFYFADGRKEGMRIFEMSGNSGHINNLFTAPSGGGVRALCMGTNEVYVLVSDKARRVDKRIVRSYRIRVFTENLLPTATSIPLSIHPEEQAVDLYYEDGIFFITALSDDGEQAEVYPAPAEAILPEVPDPTAEGGEGGDAAASGEGGEEAEEEPTPLDSIYLKDSGSGRFFSDAAYRSGSLLVRTDADPAAGVFAVDGELLQSLRNADPNFGQALKLCGNFLPYWVAGTLLGLVFIILMFLAFYNRRRLIYTALLIEVIFAGMMAVFAWFYFDAQSDALRDSRIDYATDALLSLAGECGRIDDIVADAGAADYFDSDIYRDAQGNIIDFIRRDGNSNVFYDTFLISLKSSQLVVSASGRNRQYVNEVYGDGAEGLWRSLSEGASVSRATAVIGGQDYGLIGITQGGMRSECALVGVINEVSPSIENWTSRLSMLGLLLVIYALGSIVLFFVLWLQSADLRQFEKAISEVAVGGRTEQKGLAIGRDMDGMWNSLLQIQKRIEKINYNRYRIYEAYFRFAPKSIERILGRDSITEVACGDTAYLTGTLAFIASDEKAEPAERIEKFNHLIDFLEERQGEEGIIISNNSERAVMELLFLEDQYGSQNFGVSLAREHLTASHRGPVFNMFLYYGAYTYGVAGSEDTCEAFLLADELAELSRIAEWLRVMKMSLVVTGEVRDREDFHADFRYIGFMRLSSGRELKLYEILDALPQRERLAKLTDAAAFDEAMGYFYKHDYYLARTRFSEVLKRIPEDEIVRWYLFESERLLDAAPGENRDGALRPDIR